MSIYLSKNNQTTGPFEESVILDWLNKGQLKPEDLACRQGAASWQPLNTLIQVSPQKLTSVSNLQNSGKQTVVEWAKQNLNEAVEVKIKGNSLVAKGIFLVFLFSLPILLSLLGFYSLITTGLKNFFNVMIVAVISFGFFGLILALIMFTRRKFAAKLDAEGVETIWRKKYLWQDLQYIEYKRVTAHTGSSGAGLLGILLASVIRAIMFSGSEKINTELVFADGKSMVPAMSYNQRELVDLIRTIPIAQNDA